MQEISPAIQYILLLGFLLSLIFYRKASRQRLPLQVFLVLGPAIVLVLQRVAPLARVWMYLAALYMLFAGTGLAWLAGILLTKTHGREHTTRIVSTAILVIMLLAWGGVYMKTQQGSLVPNRGDFPEQHAAEYLASHLQAQDKILSIAPVDIQTAYYLYMYGVPYQAFYQRDNPVEAQNAVIVLRTNSKYNTPEAVLKFYKIVDKFDLASARPVYKYGPIQIFSVPAR